MSKVDNRLVTLSTFLNFSTKYIRQVYSMKDRFSFKSNVLTL